MLSIWEYNYSGKNWDQCARGFYGFKCSPWPIDPSTREIWGVDGVWDDGMEGDGKWYWKYPGLDPKRFWRKDTYNKGIEEEKEKEQELGFILILIVVFMWSLLLYLYNMIQELHIFPESIAAILIGIFLGFYFKIIHGQSGLINVIEFEPHLFFLILIPPIMFQAGFWLDMKTFFKNIFTINAYAIFATLIASFAFGGIFYYGSMLTPFNFPFLNSLHFGCFISAIDPVATISIFNSLHVNDQIYMIVFGESTLNDAVAIALSNSVSDINEQIMSGEIPDYNMAALYAWLNFLIYFFGSTIVGLIISFIAWLIFSKLDFYEQTWIEVALFGMCAYLPYIISEFCGLSGILAIFTAGIVMRDYAFCYLSGLGKITVEFFVETAGFISENFVFAYLGISIPLMMVNLNWPLVLIGWFALLVSRIISVLIVSLAVNIFRKDKIKFSHQWIMSYGGLRGAVAFYLSLNVNSEYKHLVIMLTICLILFTVIGLGTTTTCLLTYLNEKFPDDQILQTGEEEIRLEDDESVEGQRKPSYFDGLYDSQNGSQKEQSKPLEESKSIDFENYEDEDFQQAAVHNKDRDQIEAFFNRADRGGDISPFRTGDLQFGKTKITKKKSIFGRFSGLGDGMYNKPEASITRKFSEGFQRRSTTKIAETPTFAMTTKYKRGSTNINTFGDLAKSNSVNVVDERPLGRENNRNTFNANVKNPFVISEEDSDANSDDNKIQREITFEQNADDVQPHFTSMKENYDKAVKNPKVEGLKEIKEENDKKCMFKKLKLKILIKFSNLWIKLYIFI